MRPLPIESLAATPRHILGVSLIRGVSVPVVDAGALLAPGPARTTRFLLLRVEDRRVALAVEAISGMRAISTLSLRELPPLLGDASRDIVDSIGSCDEKFLLVLKAARLLEDSAAVAHG